MFLSAGRSDDPLSPRSSSAEVSDAPLLPRSSSAEGSEDSLSLRSSIAERSEALLRPRSSVAERAESVLLPLSTASRRRAPLFMVRLSVHIRCLQPLTENACGWRGWSPQACRDYSISVYQAESTSSSELLCRFLFMPYASTLPARIIVRCFSSTVCIVGFIYSFFVIVVSSFAYLLMNTFLPFTMYRPFVGFCTRRPCKS